MDQFPPSLLDPLLSLPDALSFLSNQPPPPPQPLGSTVSFDTIYSAWINPNPLLPTVGQAVASLSSSSSSQQPLQGYDFPQPQLQQQQWHLPVPLPPQQQDESSVPEAALHLLRLALPPSSSSSSGAAGDEDADAEGESDGEPPSSPKIPKGGSENIQRRTSGRVRKTLLPPEEFKASLDDEDPDTEEGSDDEFHDIDTSLGSHKKPPPTSTASKGKARASPPPPSPSNKRPLSPPPASPSLPPPPPKKIKTTHPPLPRRPKRVAPPVTGPTRTFPTFVEMDLVGFPRLYRRFPVSSAFPPDSYVHRLKLIGEEGGEAEIESGIVVGSGGWGEARGGNGVVGSSGEDPDLEPTFMQPPADAKWNKACDPFNLYAPKFVKGLGDEKMGLCPICVEGVERGGEGGERWLKLKNSSYVYHLSYQHGLSNLTGLPFSPPTKLRTINLHPTSKDARDHMVEGLCHKCDKWIPMLSVKNVNAVVPELIWWKHAKPCHTSSTISGEGDYYLTDDVFLYLINRKPAPGSTTAPAALPAPPPPPAPVQQPIAGPSNGMGGYQNVYDLVDSHQQYQQHQFQLQQMLQAHHLQHQLQQGEGSGGSGQEQF